MVRRKNLEGQRKVNLILSQGKLIFWRKVIRTIKARRNIWGHWDFSEGKYVENLFNERVGSCGQKPLLDPTFSIHSVGAILFLSRKFGKWCLLQPRFHAHCWRVVNIKHIEMNYIFLFIIRMIYDKAIVVLILFPMSLLKPPPEILGAYLFSE